MSRRRQRGAAYRARRAQRTHQWRMLNDVFYRAAIEIQRAMGDEVVRNTAAYAEWLVPHVATGAALDELCKLTPVDADEFKRRLEAVRPARQLPDGTWDVEYGLA